MIAGLGAVKWLAAASAAGLLALAALVELDRAFPPPLPKLSLSTEVTDRNDTLLRVYATPEGRWRMGVQLGDIDPQFLAMLVAYEDQRFHSHAGVDPLAMARAFSQLVMNGRIVSGGSTLTMQLARLLEPRQSRSVRAKLIQMVRAIQIERRLSKDDILRLYLTLAPYGGNVEGVRAASLAWFGKEPKKLRVSEAALLIALPQLPELRRPDRHPENARRARNRVLARMANADVIIPAEVERAATMSVPNRRRAQPALAAHLSDEVIGEGAPLERYRLTIERNAQHALETVAAEAANRLGRHLSVAMVLADAATGEVLAHVGSPGHLTDTRAGWIDMTRVARSPGSTLKPFIYGLAFEEGMVAAETIIEDRPADFGGYRPTNFDSDYRGDVSVREALQLSLNVPAVRLLDVVGPQRLTARFRKAGVTLKVPGGEPPGLAVGLGGAGVSLRDLVGLYTGLATGGRAAALRYRFDPAARTAKTDLMSPAAAWQVATILSEIHAPNGAAPAAIAYKTGTSYGYRDAWAIGFDGAHVLGVWVGRADNAAVPGISGGETAAPILFEGFAKAGLEPQPLPSRPAGAVQLSRADLPASLRRFSSGRAVASAGTALEPEPDIVYPPDGARIALSVAGGADLQALVLKLQGGQAPFRWLANGKPLAKVSRRRIREWQPDGAGYSRLTVIDAAGRAASVGVVIE